METKIPQVIEALMLFLGFLSVASGFICIFALNSDLTRDKRLGYACLGMCVLTLISVTGLGVAYTPRPAQAGTEALQKQVQQLETRLQLLERAVLDTKED